MPATTNPNFRGRQSYVNMHRKVAAGKGFDLAQPKHDGCWSRLEINTEAKGECRIYVRDGSPKATIAIDPSIESATIIGEYLFGTNWSQRADRNGKVIGFDLLAWDGKEYSDVCYHDRLHMLDAYIQTCGLDFLVVVESFPIEEVEVHWERLVNGPDKFEGMVFRKSMDSYAGTLARQKEKYTMDYVITGKKEGLGKMKGMVGKLEGSLYVDGVLKLVCRIGGGMSNAERRDIWNNFEKYRGRVLECYGWQLFESGALRHPNAARDGKNGPLKWRDDKPASECVKPMMEVQS